MVEFNIAQARRYAGLTQREMADELGMDRGSYAKLEKDPDKAPLRVVGAVSDITGIPIERFFYHKNPLKEEKLARKQFNIY